MRSLIAAALTNFLIGAAAAQPAELAVGMPGATQVGAARYQALGFAVFDAALWAEDGAFSWEAPFALELRYRRHFSARSLADRSIVEMSRRSGQAPSGYAALRPRLRACFADVAPGDRIIGVSTGPDNASFYFNSEWRCTLQWRGLRRSFFGIWLDRTGRERAFSRRLLGEL